MRDSFKLELSSSFCDAGNQYSTSPSAGGAAAGFQGTRYTGAAEPPPPFDMPPPPPPPPPPQVAHDDCAKRRARSATAIDRANWVFMARGYNRAVFLNEPGGRGNIGPIRPM